MFGTLPLDVAIGPVEDAVSSMPGYGWVVLGVLAVLAAAALVAIILIIKHNNNRK